MDAPQFPGFEIIETMPRGGMSTVYKARQLSLDRIVALKTLPLTLAAEAADLDQFLAEARLTANLKHPNIVQVYDFGRAESGEYYFVMEFVSGYSVGDWIRRKQRLSEENALLVAQSVAEAMGYAWRTARIVHCDIKPDNLIIDGDGTVKVADLGLAKSMQLAAGRAAAPAEMVFGTPNYISPEQSRGDAGLDCRSDIYSLGATLYHCLTGKMPFAGSSSLLAMDLQITDQIDDVQDVNPRVSPEAASLLEKMLAKECHRRQADWDDVVADIQRVIQGKMPLGELPPPGASTMRRSPQRGRRPHAKAAVTAPLPVAAGVPDRDSTAFRNMERQFLQKQKRKRQVKPEWWVAGAIALAVLILGILVARSVAHGGRPAAAPGGQGGAAAPAPAAPAPAPSPAPAAPAPAGQGEGAALSPAELRARARENSAREMFEFAYKWAQEHPARVDDIIQQYKNIANETRGTKYSLMALTEIDKLKDLSRVGADNVMRALDEQAAALIGKNEFAQAAAVYDQYQGPWAAETMERRGAPARELRERDARYRQQKNIEETERQWRQLVDMVGDSLVAGDVPGALALVKQAAELPALAARAKEIGALKSLLAAAALTDQRLLDSFRKSQGKEVTVSLLTGAEKVTIRGVQEDTIQADQITLVGAGQISRPKTFRIADLTLAEKRLRLGSEEGPALALMQGLLAVRDRDWKAAAACFAKTDPLLAGALLAKLGEHQTAQSEDQARRDFKLLLRSAKIDSAGDNAACEVYLAAIQGKTYPAREAQALAKMVEKYRAACGQTRFAGQYEPVLEALARAAAALEREPAPQPQPAGPAAPQPAGTPAPQPPPSVKLPYPAPAREAAPSSGSKLLLRPGAPPEEVKSKLLDLNPGLDAMAVTFNADEAGRVVQVRIDSASVKDLRPLAALADVRAIIFQRNPPLTDLSPLRGLPLHELQVNGALVKDLGPLLGMPLNKLGLARTKVAELTWLKGLPLNDLNLEGTRIRDIGALRAMPLRDLNLNDTDVADIGPLNGMALERLALARTRVQDLRVLRGMPLVALDLGGTDIKDWTVLSELPLKDLSLAHVKAADFSFIANLKLQRLSLAGTDCKDVAILRKMPLQDLDLSGTKIKDGDLARLSELPLHTLRLDNTEFKELSDLQYFTALRRLSIRQTRVRDLSPIQDKPIEALWLDQDPERFWPVLRRMPNLQQVNGMPWGFAGNIRRRR